LGFVTLWEIDQRMGLGVSQWVAKKSPGGWLEQLFG
jgi:hypothetical protein